MDTERVLAIRRISAAIAAASILTHVGSHAGVAAASSSPPDDSGSASSDAGAGSPLNFGRLQDDERIETSEHVAAIPGTDIYAAFALSRLVDSGDFDGALAYFCDGQSVANWFRLVDSSDGLTFENAAGAQFIAQLDDDGTIVAVNVPIGDVTYTMLVPQVDADGEAGLYLADFAIDADLATDERAGWIVLPDGTQRGAIRSDTTVLPGTTLTSGSTSVTVAGREVLLRSITHIIGLDMAD